FAAQHRIEIFFLLIGIERQQDRAHLRPEDAGAARRQRYRAGELFGDDRDREQTEVLAAELCRYLEKPQSQLARLGFELLADVGLEVGSVHGVHLDRDQFSIDKAPDGVLEDTDVLRQLEVHTQRTLNARPLRTLWGGSRAVNVVDA